MKTDFAPQPTLLGTIHSMT